MRNKIQLGDKKALEVFESVVSFLPHLGLGCSFDKSNEEGHGNGYHRYRTRIFVNGSDVFEVEDHEYFLHEFNQGGYRQRESVMYRVIETPSSRERRDVLHAKNYTQWITSMNDSEDEEKFRFDDIASEDDEFTLDLIRRATG
jgi:hypothetical protein